MSYETVMNFLFDNRADNLRLDVLSDLFDRLIWISSDNGREVCDVRKKWLEGEDSIKVEIALLMEEVFPYEDRNAMLESFSRIKRTWPSLAPNCDLWILKWDGEKGRNP